MNSQPRSHSVSTNSAGSVTSHATAPRRAEPARRDASPRAATNAASTSGEPDGQDTTPSGIGRFADDAHGDVRPVRADAEARAAEREAQAERAARRGVAPRVEQHGVRQRREPELLERRERERQHGPRDDAEQVVRQWRGSTGYSAGELRQARDFERVQAPPIAAQHLEAQAREVELLAAARQAAELVHDEAADGVVVGVADARC